METDGIKIIEVSKPKINRANIARSTGMMIGLVFFGLGVLMCLSIILFIPGIFGVLIGLVLMTMNVPKAIVACPSCEYENKAAPPNVSVECERCKTNIPIKWAEEKRGFWTRSIFAKK